jgi:hypothetical protein
MPDEWTSLGDPRAGPAILIQLLHTRTKAPHGPLNRCAGALEAAAGALCALRRLPPELDLNASTNPPIPAFFTHRPEICSFTGRGLRILSETRRRDDLPSPPLIVFEVASDNIPDGPDTTRQLNELHHFASRRVRIRVPRKLRCGGDAPFDWNEPTAAVGWREIDSRAWRETASAHSNNAHNPLPIRPAVTDTAALTDTRVTPDRSGSTTGERCGSIPQERPRTEAESVPSHLARSPMCCRVEPCGLPAVAKAVMR